MITICMIGPSCSGKTSLAHRYTTGQICRSPTLTIQDTYRKPITVGDINYHAEIIDTSGSEEYRNLVESQLTMANVVMLVVPYNTDEITSAETIRYIRMAHKPESQMFNEIKRKIILVLSQTDRTTDQNHIDSLIEDLCEIYDIPAWIKTSAHTGINVDKTFHLAYTYALEHYRKVNTLQTHLLSPPAINPNLKTSAGRFSSSPELAILTVDAYTWRRESISDREASFSVPQIANEYLSPRSPSSGSVGSSPRTVESRVASPSQSPLRMSSKTPSPSPSPRQEPPVAPKKKSTSLKSSNRESCISM